MDGEILQTDRLVLRKIKTDDYKEVCGILQDIEVMYAWEHAFTDNEVISWINENIDRYQRDGFSYFAAINKADGTFVGVAGIIKEKVNGKEYIGLGYIFNKAFWKQGLAFEVVNACKKYALEVLQVKELTAQIRPDNISSRNLAEKLGMGVKCEFIRNYKGKDILHLLYSLTE